MRFATKKPLYLQSKILPKMVVIWNRALDCCKTIYKMTSEDQGSIAFYKNDSIDEDSEKGEDGEGYYFVNEERGIPVGNKLVFCPYCGMQIKVL